MLALVMLAIRAAALVQAQPSPAAYVAVDEGARLRPLAQRSGAVWVPIPADGLARLPREWTRVDAGGNRATIRVSTPPTSGTCATAGTLPLARSAGLPGDSTSRSPSRLALAGSVQLEALTRVTSSSRQWPQLERVIRSVADRRLLEGGVSAAALARVPLTVDAVHAAARRPGNAVYYFEASKRLPDAGETPDEDPKGILRIVVSGWLREIGSRILPAGTRSELHWEPATPRTGFTEATLTPLGVLRQGSETVWVMRSETGARVTFTLYTVGESSVRTLFTVRASGC